MQRWTRSAAAAIAIFATAGITACSDDKDGDPSGPGGDASLTVVESQALMEVLLGGAFMGFGGASFSAVGVDLLGGDLGLRAGSPPIDEPFEISGPCDLGGTIQLTGRITGNVDDDTGHGTMAMNLDFIHSACRAQASNGQIFTINGDPKIRLETNFTSSETAFAYNGSMTGNVRWGTGSKDGRCAISVNYSANMNMNTGAASGSSSGTVCGNSVSETF